jgi:uncharacterized membrane protein YtjA (UPF0391 family)
MLGWALAFAMLAILAAMFGFTGMLSGAAWAAQVLFFVFVLLFVVAAIAFAVRRQPSRTRRPQDQELPRCGRNRLSPSR